MKLGRAELGSIALAVVALASVVLVLMTRHAPTTAERDERAGNLLSTFRSSELSRLEFRQAARSFAVERAADGNTFTLLTPKAEPANDAAVDRVIDALGFATPLRRLPGQDPAALGLATPRATLALTFQRSSYRLALGKEAPAPAGAAYVSVQAGGGEPSFFVVSRDVASLLLTSLEELEDHALVKLGESDVGELALERPDQAFRLLRAKSGAFRVEGGGRASRDALEPLFRALAGLQATRLLPVGEAERARGATPRTVVRLGPLDATQPKLTLELGGACPGAPTESLAIVRGVSTRAGCVKNEMLAPFSLARESLLDDAPFSAKMDEVETLSIVRGDKRLVLTRQGTGFLLREPSSAEVELEAGNQRLTAVVRASAELLHDPSLEALGLAAPKDKVVLTVLGHGDKASEETLELGRAEPDGSLAARRVDDGAVLRFGREAARAFLVDSTLLRSRRLLDFALSALTELELSRPERQVLKRVVNGFELTTPSGFQADGELSTNVVLGLGSLTAVRWVADADDGSFGLTTPRLTARAHFEQADAGVAERTLVVGGVAPGGYFARFSDQPGVFLLERALVERLETLLVDRSALMADPATLARVTLQKGSTRIALERRGGELVPSAGSKLDPSAVAPLLETLGALRAEAAVHTGAALPSEGFVEPVLSVSLEPSPGLGKPRAFRLGAPEVYHGLPVRFARADGVDATFVLAEAKARPLLDLF